MRHKPPGRGSSSRGAAERTSSRRDGPARASARKAHDKTPATVARVAAGRDQSAFTDHRGPPMVWGIALDVIARQRATAEPLLQVVQHAAREHRLGPRERAAVSDLVWGFARLRTPLNKAVDDAVTAYGGRAPSVRDRDLCALVLSRLCAGLDVDDAMAARVPEACQALVAAVKDGSVVLGHAALEAWPPWLSAAIEKDHGDDAPALLQALATPAPFCVAVDTRLMSVPDALAALIARGVNATPSPHQDGALNLGLRLPRGTSLSTLPKPLQAALWPMDDGSQLVAAAVGAAPGLRVLDLCAGGGGKARALLARGAHVTAVDLDAARLKRSIPQGAVAVHADGQDPPFADDSFDAVLVDAPCSGTGTLRRAPDLAHRLDEKSIIALGHTQRGLLRAALRLVKPGGLVLYATCSVLRRENDDVVDDVLRDAPTSGVVREVPLVNVPRAVAGDAPGRLQLLPHRHDTDGFFLCALQKTATGGSGS